MQKEAVNIIITGVHCIMDDRQPVTAVFRTRLSINISQMYLHLRGKGVRLNTSHSTILNHLSITIYYVNEFNIYLNDTEYNL